MRRIIGKNVFIDFAACLFIKPEFYRNVWVENTYTNVYSFRWLFFQINFIYEV